MQKQVLIKLGKRQNKYHNKPEERGRIKFQSKKEAKRYDDLMLMLKAGQIRDLQLQRDFTLQEAYTTPEGKRIRAIRYRADFVYERRTLPDQNGNTYWILVAEDVKSRGTRTQVYIDKKKQMQFLYGIHIEEV